MQSAARVKKTNKNRLQFDATLITNRKSLVADRIASVPITFCGLKGKTLLTCKVGFMG